MTDTQKTTSSRFIEPEKLKDLRTKQEIELMNGRPWTRELPPPVLPPFGPLEKISGRLESFSSERFREYFDVDSYRTNSLPKVSDGQRGTGAVVAIAAGSPGVGANKEYVYSYRNIYVYVNNSRFFVFFCDLIAYSAYKACAPTRCKLAEEIFRLLGMKNVSKINLNKMTKREQRLIGAGKWNDPGDKNKPACHSGRFIYSGRWKYAMGDFCFYSPRQ